ncbi:carbohydrate ABC transporter permease [Meiothermus granaticius]|uniref:L-arabinose transport system permease protein AraQ n=1 Tax=Meiothermus granaticius NBRC 107808 TaxID=1227551 RepID=A0A399F8N3_9DEIN|nr:carbohydrate ABC transporter permease [Meiothermus granaticius]RIH93014.1 L-arabinose transport system permease protein AraQ [Meiothermus granaticius NBRC 107808]GEM86148.1 sugar ABC transporter permease [Meiothermus granaticius NBRC 107808]
MARPRWPQLLAIHAVLIAYSALALFPVLLVIINSFKDKLLIFSAPFSLPTTQSFTLEGYKTLQSTANFPAFFLNSLIVTGGALLLILLVSSMAAFALAEYEFRLNPLTALYLSLGIMVPIRLGTVGILQLAVDLHLVNTLWILILVYTAQGIPLAVFVLTAFMRQLPKDLKDAARIDGASEYRIYWLTLPLVRPAIGSVLAISMIPIWNDLWFPLILAPGEATKTIVLGASVFLGQFVNDYNAVLAALTLAIVPAVVLYFIFSQQLIRGITSGAVK